MELFKYFLFTLLLIGFEASQRMNRTTLRSTLERMLSRKKRFLLMPPGAHFKFTLQLSKRLLAMYPRGFNYVIEAALYYPCPGSRLDLIPKRLRKPTTTTPKPKVTKPPLFVCIPGSLICYKAKPALKPMKVQRIDENITSTQWIEPQQSDPYYPNYQKYQNYGQQYANPQKWAQWSKYGHEGQYEKYKWKPTMKQEEIYQQNWQPKPQSSWRQWTTRTPPSQKWQQPPRIDYTKWTQPRFRQYQDQQKQQRWRRTLTLTEPHLSLNNNQEDSSKDPLEELFSSYKPMDIPELEPHYNWQHYHSHRDRRQLFHQFEGLSQILGIDMKSCIVRAICESKRYLLPPGYSMLHDILRLIFTLPTINGLTDDYSRAMKTDFETCDKFLRPKCPFNILDWFINSEKTIQ